jgi:heme/copper-type cytochrome/quinol oxidase subunit 3
MSDVPLQHRLADDRGHAVPVRVQTFGMVLFLVTLTMLFGSTMLLYVILRLRAGDATPPGALRGGLVNPKLFLSTLIVLAASLTIHMAVLRIRRHQLPSFFRWLIATDLLAVAFLAVQTPAMIQILGSQPEIPPDTPSLAAGGNPVTQLYKLLFVLVAIHALHVLGGVIYLWVVTRRALAGVYDHEYYTGVHHAALYWHFLDVVWLTMFGMFLVLG